MSAPQILRPWQQPLLPFAAAVIGAWLALTPSLLPRTALFQGALCAVAAILGYALGALVRWICLSAGWRPGDAPRRRARRIAILVAIAGSAGMLWISHLWQQDQRASIGMPAASAWDPLVAAGIAVAVFAALLVIARAVRGAARWLGDRTSRWLPRRVSAVVGALLVAWLTIWLVNGVAVGSIARALDRVYLATNDDFAQEIDPPSVPELSAGPGSLTSWEQLGRQGRVFIANAPCAARIDEFLEARGSGTAAANGSRPTAAMQPVRVYIGGGTEGALDLRAQADAAVAELERAGGFDRAVLNVVTGTGRGWVNENQARALEFMWGGDTATVSMQYSYLPSWMSYLVDEQRAREAGRALFEAVYAHWAGLPEHDRPLLVASGESLGSFGSEGAFSGAQDLATRTDGALYVGPTANNVLWQGFTADREPGSAAFLPVYGSGETVRFSPDGEDWGGEGRWRQPRVGYLQHANDPVTWLDFGIALSPPEWLRGERGPGVPGTMIWVPVLTALQLAVDQLASGIPDGQGHEFGQAPARAWAAILPPAGWSDADTELLAGTLAELRPLDIDTSSS